MIDHESHKLVLLSAGISEEAFNAQRALMKMALNDYIRNLKRHLDAVPLPEFQRNPTELKRLFVNLIADVAK